MEYTQIVRNYLLLAIRKILTVIMEGGMDRFCAYIGFKQFHKGVIFPRDLSDEEVVTIVIQHQFWGLKVDPQGFSVVLDFFGTKQQIYVPFEAITVFCDPDRGFRLDFSNVDQNENEVLIDEYQKDKDDQVIFVNLSNQDE